MTEQQIQKKIIKELESCGAYVVKVISANKSGVPDIIACIDGNFIGIEVKRPETKNNVSRLQEKHIEMINDCGGFAFVAWSVEMILDKLTERGLI
jgi:Holliday junction resolvase